jgi:hypothetical protein
VEAGQCQCHITVGGAVIFFILYLVFRDIPPFFYYVLTFIAGVRLML